MKNKHTDAIVIGAGAGGGVVAKELAVNGIRVVLMERGGWPIYDEHANDEFIAQRGQVLKAAFGPDPAKNPRVYISKGKDGEDIVSNYGTHIAECVGSGTVSYGAMAWRFMPEDFKMKSVYGEVKDSTLDDWPISYDDLEPYYEKAEWEIGVAGDDSENPFAPPRKKNFPMPAFENNEDGILLAEACKRLGLHPFPIPMARNSVPYNGRAACIRNRTCVGFACPVDSKNGTHNTVIPAAIKTGNCELRTHCRVLEILMADNGKAKGVRYVDQNGQERIQTAELVIVAASAIESARLLLTTRTSQFPNGLGNNNDWVGRNLQGHAYTGARGIFNKDIHRMAGPGATFAICDFNHHNDGIIGGGLLANEFYKLPNAFSKFRPPNSASWGLEHKEFQRKNFFRYVNLFGPIQEMPNFEARVVLYDKIKDHWGMPVVAGMGGRHPLDAEHCKFLADKAEKIILEAGAEKVWKIPGGQPLLQPGSHQVGTCRMGDDPAKSVVNRYGQVHDIDNLFVADGSVFVTAGGFNPALTIMALGYWIGDHIAKKFTSGNKMSF
jgi:choline dehydrogenase-like flavoprotein